MIESILRPILLRLPVLRRENVKLRLLGLLKIPVIYYVGARVQDMTERRCVIQIPLNRRTQNHYGSMYFGVLAVGADLACGFLAQFLNEEKANGKISLLFKDFKADFLKRPEGDVHFICEEGERIQEGISVALSTKERQNFPVRVYAVVPKVSENQIVAEFILTLSLKAK